MSVRVGIFVIASAINVLAWLKEEQDVPTARFSHCRFGTSEILFSRVNSLVSADNARE